MIDGTKNIAKKDSERTILITNDDSVMAPGIRALIQAVKHLGKIYVVAPDKPQSGMGHAITLNHPLRLTRVPMLEEPNVQVWQVNGTPVDCVKLAVDKVIKGHPNICLSGINHGPNYSISVIYSGTMSAALEAAIESIPSIGFSLLDGSMEADFSAAQVVAAELVEKILGKNIDKHLCLNVNIPAVPHNLIRGMKVCRQAYARYEEVFDERKDPAGNKYYWLTGDFVNFDDKKDTDVWALENNYVSVVPVKFDLTDYSLLDKLGKIV